MRERHCEVIQTNFGRDVFFHIKCWPLTWPSGISVRTLRGCVGGWRQRSTEGLLPSCWPWCFAWCHCSVCSYIINHSCYRAEREVVTLWKKDIHSILEQIVSWVRDFISGNIKLQTESHRLYWVQTVPVTHSVRDKISWRTAPNSTCWVTRTKQQ